MSIEAMKLALEALEDCVTDDITPYQLTKAITALRQAIAEAGQCQCPECKVALHASDCAVHNEPAYPKGECNCGATNKPEFTKHIVDDAADWSEWVCPDPESYLMKCCDCGLVHETQFGVVRYKSETEREDCDKVDDPNLQTVFRMRRHEAWQPEDTAHRAGGLPMEQAQPVAWAVSGKITDWSKDFSAYKTQLYTRPVFLDAPPQRKPLSDEEIIKCWGQASGTRYGYIKFARTIEAAHGIKE